MVALKSSWLFSFDPPLWSCVWQLGLMSKRLQPPKHPHYLGTEFKHICTNFNTPPPPREAVYKPCRTMTCWDGSYLPPLSSFGPLLLLRKPLRNRRAGSRGQQRLPASVYTWDTDAQATGKAMPRDHQGSGNFRLSAGLLAVAAARSRG